MVKASEHIDTLNTENGILAKKISELEKTNAGLITDNKLREIQLNKNAHEKEIKTLEESVAQLHDLSPGQMEVVRRRLIPELALATAQEFDFEEFG